jgi:hypothetical protein
LKACTDILDIKELGSGWLCAAARSLGRIKSYPNVPAYQNGEELFSAWAPSRDNPAINYESGCGGQPRFCRRSSMALIY